MPNKKPLIINSIKGFMLSCQGSNLNSSAPEADVLPVTPQDNEVANVQKLKLIRQTF